MVDTDKLIKAVKHFAFYSTPSNGDHSAPCTVGDIHKVINNISKVLYTFIDELEKEK